MKSSEEIELQNERITKLKTVLDSIININFCTPFEMISGFSAVTAEIISSQEDPEESLESAIRILRAFHEAYKKLEYNESDDKEL